MTMLSVPVLTSAALALLMQAHPSPVDPQRLDDYSRAWTTPQADARLEAQARAEFGGRGVAFAEHFLRHTGPRPSNDAFYFVLRTVGDPDTALTLIRALSNPPARESGMLDRHSSEIAAAIEAVLAGGAARCDTRVVLALGAAVSAARSRPHGTGRHDAVDAVRLLGTCRSDEAARVLARLTEDPESAIRAAAAAALGHMSRAGQPEATGPGGRTFPSQHLLQALASDPDPAVRRQAADSLGLMNERTGIDEALHAALAQERDPRVLDGIVQALRMHGGGLRDPDRCGELAGRVWEAPVAQYLLECRLEYDPSRAWLMRAALEGPATRRAAAVSALAGPARQGTTSPIAVARSVPSESFEPELRDRLLNSIVWVLSQDEGLSTSSRASAELALWQLAERDMTRAVRYADRVTPYAARFRASEALARAESAAYGAARRSQQTGLALVLVLALGLLAAAPRLRRPSLLLATSAALWGLWTLQADGARDLPPPPRQLLTVGAVGLLTAGMVAAAARTRVRDAHSSPAWLLRAALTALVAAASAGTLCLASRANGLLPDDLSGWRMIIDPLAAAVLAAAGAAILLLLDRVLFDRLFRTAGLPGSG